MHRIRNQLNLISLASRHIADLVASHEIVRAMEVAEQVQLATAGLQSTLSQMHDLEAGHDLKRVLVVEDDSIQRRMIAEAFRESGYFVAEADNGNGAIEYLYSAAQPDVIITDLSMPSCSGWELSRVARTSPVCRGVLLVSLSGNAVPAATEGFDLTVAKPVDTKVMIAQIDQLLASRDGERDAA
ncbi:MAG: response regulator [Planctomycetaceae bacterium]